MTEEAEAMLRDRIFPDLERGRPGWDAPHTKAVVFYVRDIIRNTAEYADVDVDSLVIAAYAHDWGYADLFNNGVYVGLDEVKKMKTQHAKLSAQKIAVLLGDSVFDFLTQQQKQRIEHLVLVHDELENLEHRDELVLMEADTLGQLDISYVTPTFSKDDNEKYMESVGKNRIAKFITPFAKARADELVKLRMDFYK